MSTLTLGTIDTLTALQAQIGTGNEKQGFHDDGHQIQSVTHWIAEGPVTGSPLERLTEASRGAHLRHYIMAKLGLIITEAAEGIEEVRKGHAATETYYSGGAPSPGGYHELESVDVNGNPRKPEGLPSELADVVIRAFDLAHEFDIDLAASIDEKLTFNASRQRLHGKKL